MTRRGFIKKSTMAGGALSILARGTALSRDSTECTNPCSSWERSFFNIYTDDPAENTGPYWQVGVCKCVANNHSVSSWKAYGNHSGSAVYGASFKPAIEHVSGGHQIHFP